MIIVLVLVEMGLRGSADNQVNLLVHRQPLISNVSTIPALVFPALELALVVKQIHLVMSDLSLILHAVIIAALLFRDLD